VIDRQHPAYQARNPVAELALGALSLGRRLDVLLAPRAARPARNDPDDALALALLGLLSLRRTVWRHVAGSLPVESAQAGSAVSTPSEPPQDLLR